MSGHGVPSNYSGAIAEPSSIRRHMLAGIGVMVREAGMYTQLVADVERVRGGS